MGWLEAQDRYHKGETITDQAVEDLVARRVLRGLGLTQAGLPQVERAIFGTVDYDEAQWPRTLRMLKYALTAEGFANYAEHHVFECYESTGDHKDILGRLEEVPGREVTHPVFLTRIKGTTTSMTYTVWNRESLPAYIKTPFSAIAEIRGLDEIGDGTDNLVIVQETEHYVRQFMEQSLFKEAAQRAAGEDNA